MASKLEYILQAVARVVQPLAANTAASGSQALNLSLTQVANDTADADDLQYNPFLEIPGGSTAIIPLATMNQVRHVFVQITGKGPLAASSFIPLFNYEIQGAGFSVVPVNFVILEFDISQPISSLSIQNPDATPGNAIQIAYVLVGKP